MEYETRPDIYLVNYKSKRVEIENCEEHELLKWFNDGFIRVDKRTYWECRERFIKEHQARIRKSELQRLRRLQGPRPTKPKK